jgi:hypothetical protein
MPVTITRPAALEEQGDGALELAVDAIDKAEDGGRFRSQDLARQLEAGHGIAHL